MNTFLFLLLPAKIMGYSCFVVGLTFSTIALPQSVDSIIDGDLASYHQTPYVVSIQRDNQGQWQHLCAGTLIDDHIVLTAAHCLLDISPESLRVYFGSSDLTKYGLEFSVAKTKLHKQYNHPEKYNHDIALLYVPHLYGYQLAELADKDFIDSMEPEQRTLLVGWGMTKRNGNASTNLRETELKYLSYHHCIAFFKQGSPNWRALNIDPNWLNEKHVCALPKYFGAPQSCYGDSGGPLLAKSGGRYLQVGLLSFGSPHVPSFGMFGCGLLGEPAVYTRVADYRQWIDRAIASFNSDSMPINTQHSSVEVHHSEQTDSEASDSVAGSNFKLLILLILIFGVRTCSDPKY
ncbi:serine protease [Thalassotalea agarivorans]|uniref:Elastase-2 n=1 Tax=Thalassotalea agarivorans TaxID=349064 RepID=A0A1H9Y7Y3_THASX|nr:serine protease [Thalassotalea agarivorans]SES65046.1 elastase-2 [Thalassotalea agarivorans]